VEHRLQVRGIAGQWIPTVSTDRRQTSRLAILPRPMRRSAPPELREAVGVLGALICATRYPRLAGSHGGTRIAGNAVCAARTPPTQRGGRSLSISGCPCRARRVVEPGKPGDPSADECIISTNDEGGWLWRKRPRDRIGIGNADDEASMRTSGRRNRNPRRMAARRSQPRSARPSQARPMTCATGARCRRHPFPAGCRRGREGHPCLGRAFDDGRRLWAQDPTAPSRSGAHPRRSSAVDQVSCGSRSDSSRCGVTLRRHEVRRRGAGPSLRRNPCSVAAPHRRPVPCDEHASSDLCGRVHPAPRPSRE
jgi:hypothetical protein